MCVSGHFKTQSVHLLQRSAATLEKHGDCHVLHVFICWTWTFLLPCVEWPVRKDFCNGHHYHVPCWQASHNYQSPKIAWDVWPWLPMLTSMAHDYDLGTYLFVVSLHYPHLSSCHSVFKLFSPHDMDYLHSRFFPEITPCSTSLLWLWIYLRRVYWVLLSLCCTSLFLLFSASVSVVKNLAWSSVCLVLVVASSASAALWVFLI